MSVSSFEIAAVGIVDGLVAGLESASQAKGRSRLIAALASAFLMRLGWPSLAGMFVDPSIVDAVPARLGRWAVHSLIVSFWRVETLLTRAFAVLVDG